MLNYTQRTKLLQDVAACAPKEWNAHYYDYGGESGVWITVPGYTDGFQTALCLDDNDFTDAEAVILLQQEMDKAGFHHSLRTAISERALDETQEDTFGEHSERPGWFEVWIHYKPGLKVRQEHFAQSRAEAVARAFVACFEGRTNG